MKTKQKQNKPTAGELEILDVIWERGEATVREVYEALNIRKPGAYTTVLKLMQIMHEKGLV
ncbi:MAG TPA: BlaI/MecI/CopY family transcriptional regulator, partial [Pyrinomonadaceae bacterium]